MVVRIDKPFQLLIADDDQGFRESLRGVFDRHDCLCTLEAESGEQALELAEHRRVDIALLDMNMHRLTGLETVRRLKAMYEHLPCILITADVCETLRRDADEAEAFSVLGKPVRKRELVITVSQALTDTYYDGDESALELML